MRMMRFLKDETGAATIDWVALAAASTALGIAVVHIIYSNGVPQALGVIGDELSVTSSALQAPNTIGSGPLFN